MKNKLRVLLADDDIDNIEELSAYFKRKGWEVSLALTVRDAFMYLMLGAKVQQRYDLVISDYDFDTGVRNGLSLLRVIRKAKENDLSKVTFVLLTAQDKEHKRIGKILQENGAHYFQKPAAIPALFKFIAALEKPSE